MQVWTTARARAAMVGPGPVSLMASTTARSHRKAGLGLRLSAGADTVGSRAATRAAIPTASGRRPLMSVAHEDVAQQELAAEAAGPGDHAGGRAPGDVAV